MDANIDDFSYLFEKGEKPRNYLKTNRILGFRHAKRYQQSIQNRCKIDARKMHAKSMVNDHPTWELKSIQNLKNIGKNGIRKLMPKFDAKKCIFSPAADFHRFWIDFFGGAGG